MSGISYTFASLLGTMLECVMYGAFIPLFIAACYVQWEKASKGRGFNRLMVLATAFFGLTVTAHIAISLFQAGRVILAISSGAGIRISDGPATIDMVVWFVIFQLQVTVADVIIVYRMYHIYDMNPFVCVLPSITIAAYFAAGCGVAYQLQRPITNQKARLDWSTAGFCLTIFNSCFLTASISFRLWRVHRVTSKAGIHGGDSIILRAMKVLIESAALWTTFAMMNFLAYLAKSKLAYTFLAMSSPAVGISFCLIIVRLGQILPEARDETWHTPARNPASRTHSSSQVAVMLPEVKVQRDVYVSRSRDFAMESLESQKDMYTSSSADLPKTSRPSLSPLSHTWETPGRRQLVV